MALKSAAPDKLHYEIRSTLGGAAARGDFQFRTLNTRRKGVILGFCKDTNGIKCGFYPDDFHTDLYEDVLIASAVVDLAIE